MRRRTLSSFTVSFSIWFSSLIHFCSQQFFAVMNSPLHCRQRDSHERGDTVEWHVVEKAQPQRHCVIWWEVVQCFHHLLIPLLIRQRPSERFNLLEERLVERHSLTHVFGFALAEPQRPMPCYRGQPRRKLPRLVDTRQRFEREEQRLLRHILRIVAADDGARESNDGGAIPHDKLLERLQIPQNRR